LEKKCENGEKIAEMEKKMLRENGDEKFCKKVETKNCAFKVSPESEFCKKIAKFFFCKILHPFFLKFCVPFFS
jgi:hypothetical protein